MIPRTHLGAPPAPPQSSGPGRGLVPGPPSWRCPSGLFLAQPTIISFLRTLLCPALGPSCRCLLSMIQVLVPLQIKHPVLSKVLSQAVRAYVASRKLLRGERVGWARGCLSAQGQWGKASEGWRRQDFSPQNVSWGKKHRPEFPSLTADNGTQREKGHYVNL